MSIFFSALVSAIFAFAVLMWFDPEEGKESEKGSHRLFSYSVILPLYVLLICGVCVYKYGTGSLPELFAVFFPIFAEICVYYALLLPLLPVLRRHIGARTVALIWMLPDFLLFTVVWSNVYNGFDVPVLVLHLRGINIWWLIGVWGAGFAVVFLWKITSHLVFRHRILKNARSLDDPESVTILLEEAWRYRPGKRKQRSLYRPVVSDAVRSPLSIGLFRFTTRIVLPERKYTPKELRLIFRHEVVHIEREDVWCKYFMVFCSAVCWFDPLIWIASRKNAEDLELSCDETVLLGCDAETKRLYAELILNTAGDDSGFSTCLSSSAASVRYRLGAVMRPKARKAGALVVGVLVFLLLVCSGSVALAYGEVSGSDAIFGSDEYTLASVRRNDGRTYFTGGSYDLTGNTPDNIDADALSEYLSGLELENMSSFLLDPPDEDRLMEAVYDRADGLSLYLGIYENYLTVAKYDSRLKLRTSNYFIRGGADADFLRQIAPEIPELDVRLSDNSNSVAGHSLEVTPDVLTFIDADGSERTVRERARSVSDVSGIFGMQPDRMQLSFSVPVVSEVEVEYFPTAGGETVRAEARPEDDVFAVDPADFAAVYRVKVELDCGDGETCRAEYAFSVDWNDFAENR